MIISAKADTMNRAHIRAWHLKSSDVQVAKDHCCPLCNRPFQSQEELKAHLRNEARVCESNPPPKGTNDAVVDPEDGINSDEASVLAARKIKHKIADWHSLWRHLFVNDDKVPLPSEDPNHLRSLRFFVYTNAQGSVRAYH